MKSITITMSDDNYDRILDAFSKHPRSMGDESTPKEFAMKKIKDYIRNMVKVGETVPRQQPTIPEDFITIE